jgi:hypothetical protein
MSRTISEEVCPGTPTQVQNTARPPRAWDKAAAMDSGRTGVELQRVPTPAARESPMTNIRKGSVEVIGISRDVSSSSASSVVLGDASVLVGGG